MFVNEALTVMMWGTMKSCAAAGNRREGRLTIGPQLHKLPHISAMGLPTH